MISDKYINKFSGLDISTIELNRTANTKKYRMLYIPSNLLDIKYENFQYNNCFLNRNLLHDLTNNIIFTYYRQKSNLMVLNSQVLKNKLGNKYITYMKYLIEHKIIEKVKNYRVGTNSRVYKICDYLIENKMIKRVKNYQLSTDYLDYKYVEDPSIIENEIQKKLISDLYKVDIDAYNATIDTITSDIFNDYDENMTYESLSQYDTYNWMLGNIDKIANKEIFYKFDEYGRMHSNYTNLKSDIRKTNLTINGVEIVEFDIPNSQPTFLLLFLKRNMENIDINEYNTFKEMVIDATLYQFLSKLWSMPNKKNVKKQLFAILYGDVKFNKKNYNLFKFKNTFPTISNFIINHKKVNKNYKILAHDLQRMESEFLYNNIVKSIYLHCDGITLFTVHDCVAVPITYSNIVSSIFNDNLNKLRKLL